MNFYKIILWAVSIFFIGIYIFIALSRISYPYELEWMEGACVDSVQRVINGFPLYVEPSSDFVPYIYPPLYFYVSSLVARVTGIGFLPLRLVSFLASIGLFALIYLFVKRETKDSLSAIFGVGLFAATFYISGSWFDLARIDSLALFLLMLSCYFIRFSRAPAGYILSGLFLFLAFFTKQAMLIAGFPLAVWLLFRNWRWGLWHIGTFAGICIPVFIVMNYLTSGWFIYYVMTVPAGEPITPDAIFHFWTRDLFFKLPLAILVAIFGLRLVYSNNREAFWFYLLFCAGTILCSWISRMHVGGYWNVLIPAYLGISILLSITLNRFLVSLREANTPRARMFETTVILICLFQLLALHYNPLKLIPKDRDRDAGAKFISIISEIEGDVWIPAHGYYSVLAGKKPRAHLQAIADIYLGDKGKVKDKLIFSIRQEVIDKKFTGITIENVDWIQEYLRIDFKDYYEEKKTLFEDANAFWPVTGLKTRPEVLWIKQEP